MAAAECVVTGRWQVTRMVGQLILDGGMATFNTLSSANGPYVLLTLPGGEVSLLVTDQRALAQLGSTCSKAAQQLRTAKLVHDSEEVA